MRSSKIVDAPSGRPIDSGAKVPVPTGRPTDRETTQAATIARFTTIPIQAVRRVVARSAALAHAGLEDSGGHEPGSELAELRVVVGRRGQVNGRGAERKARNDDDDRPVDAVGRGLNGWSPRAAGMFADVRIPPKTLRTNALVHSEGDEDRAPDHEDEGGNPVDELMGGAVDHVLAHLTCSSSVVRG